MSEANKQAWEDMRAYNIRLEERAREAECALERAERERDELDGRLSNAISALSDADDDRGRFIARAEKAEQERDEAYRKDKSRRHLAARAEKAERALAEMREALKWCRAAFDTAIAGRPHPAVAEMRACVDAVLRPSEDTSDES